MDNGETENDRKDWDAVMKKGRGKEGCRIRTEEEAIAASRARGGRTNKKIFDWNDKSTW